MVPVRISGLCFSRPGAGRGLCRRLGVGEFLRQEDAGAADQASDHHGRQWRPDKTESIRQIEQHSRRRDQPGDHEIGDQANPSVLHQRRGRTGPPAGKELNQTGAVRPDDETADSHAATDAGHGDENLQLARQALDSEQQQSRQEQNELGHEPGPDLPMQPARRVVSDRHQPHGRLIGQEQEIEEDRSQTQDDGNLDHGRYDRVGVRRVSEDNDRHQQSERDLDHQPGERAAAGAGDQTDTRLA